MVRRVVKPPPTEFDSLKPYVPYADEHYWYEMVQDTKDVKDPDISLVLLAFVEGIGQPGDVVEVDAHFARFNLLLQKKAVYATPENLKEYATTKEGSTRTYSSHTVPMTIRTLANQIISVPVSSSEQWTIKPWHVCVGLRLSGISVAEGAVELPEEEISGPDLEKQNRDFLAYVIINNKERAPIRCRIHHTGEELQPEWQFIISAPILETQTEELSKLSLPKPEPVLSTAATKTTAHKRKK